MPSISLGPFGTFGYTGDPSGPGDSFSYGYGQSSSSGSTSSQSQSTSEVFPDQVWGAQAPFFEALWGAGAGLMNSGGAMQAGADVFNMGSQGYEQLLNPGSNPMIDIYAQDLANAFNQNIMPQIAQQGAGGNMLGGTRQGVAQGLAAGELQRNLQNFAGQQYAGDMQRMLGALGQLPGFGTYGMGVPWFNMNQMSGLLGPPVVLDQGSYSQSTSSSQGSDSAFGFDTQYGTTDQNLIPGAGGIQDQTPPPPGAPSGPSYPSPPGNN